MRVAQWLLAVLLSCFLLGVVQAQPRSASGRGGFGLPEVGTTLPTVTVFDEQGKEFSTASLRGQHSVLVFGCLT